MVFFRFRGKLAKAREVDDPDVLNLRMRERALDPNVPHGQVPPRASLGCGLIVRWIRHVLTQLAQVDGA